MKVVFDTNMILNAAMGRPGYEEAQELIQAVVNEKISGLITANSITDIHYVVRKKLGEETAREVIYNVLSLFDVAPVDAVVFLYDMGHFHNILRVTEAGNPVEIAMMYPHRRSPPGPPSRAARRRGRDRYPHCPPEPISGHSAPPTSGCPWILFPAGERHWRRCRRYSPARGCSRHRCGRSRAFGW